MMQALQPRFVFNYLDILVTPNQVRIPVLRVTAA